LLGEALDLGFLVGREPHAKPLGRLLGHDETGRLQEKSHES
jgi:hypothetical protein